VTVTIPSRIPWPLHRVATSGYYPDGLAVISTQWSLADVVDAWEVCDAFDAAKARAIQSARGDS
jgi:hypothetical protein